MGAPYMAASFCLQSPEAPARRCYRHAMRTAVGTDEGTGAAGRQKNPHLAPAASKGGLWA